MSHDDRQLRPHEADCLRVCRRAQGIAQRKQRLADMGYECTLWKSGGVLVGVVTNDRNPLHRRENLYFMKAWVRQDDQGRGLGRQG